jgi:hypothetical protein
MAPLIQRNNCQKTPERRLKAALGMGSVQATSVAAFSYSA